MFKINVDLNAVLLPAVKKTKQTVSIPYTKSNIGKMSNEKCKIERQLLKKHSQQHKYKDDTSHNTLNIWL